MLEKVREVFTKEYRQETIYREFTSTMKSSFKLNNKSEPVEEKVKRLQGKGFISEFKVRVAEY